MEAVIESGSSTSEQRSRGGGAALADWIAAWQPEDPAVQSARQRAAEVGVSAVDVPTTSDGGEAWTAPTWDEVVRTHSARVYRLAYRLTGNPHDAERLPSNDRGPAQVYDETHFDHDVQAALDALPPDFRAAVVLCDLEGLSYEEIAATLGVKIGTIRSRIHRGRSQLRAALAHRAPTPEPA